MNIMNYVSWEMILIVIAVNLLIDFAKNACASISLKIKKWRKKEPVAWKPNNWVIRLFVFAVAIAMAFCVSKIPGVPALGFFQGLAIGLLSIILYDSGGYPWLRGLIKGLVVSLIESLKTRFGGGA